MRKLIFICSLFDSAVCSSVFDTSTPPEPPVICHTAPDTIGDPDAWHSAEMTEGGGAERWANFCGKWFDAKQPHFTHWVTAHEIPLPFPLCEVSFPSRTAPQLSGDQAGSSGASSNATTSTTSTGNAASTTTSTGNSAGNNTTRELQAGGISGGVSGGVAGEQLSGGGVSSSRAAKSYVQQEDLLDEGGPAYHVVPKDLLEGRAEETKAATAAGGPDKNVASNHSSPELDSPAYVVVPEEDLWKQGRPSETSSWAVLMLASMTSWSRLATFLTPGKNKTIWDHANLRKSSTLRDDDVSSSRQRKLSSRRGVPGEDWFCVDIEAPSLTLGMVKCFRRLENPTIGWDDAHKRCRTEGLVGWWDDRARTVARRTRSGTQGGMIFCTQGGDLLCTL